MRIRYILKKVITLFRLKKGFWKNQKYPHVCSGIDTLRSPATQPIIIKIDASGSEIGAVLSHKLPDANQKALYHVLRVLAKAQNKYI